MRKSIVLIALLVLAAALAACSGPGATVRGSGNVKSETRQVSGFTAVALGTAGDATVVKGDSESLVIEADDNLLPLITTEVRDGRLRIDSKDNTNLDATQPIKYTVTVKDLKELSLGGSGSISASGLPGIESANLGGSGKIAATDLAGGSVAANLGGSGTITLAGTAQRLEVSIGGSGDFAGESLAVAEAEVSIGGSGNAVVRVSDKLEADIAGSGTVRYIGDPTVNSSVTGSGSIARK